MSELRFNYQFLRECGDEMGEKRDCAVIALSVVTDRPYSEIHYELKKLGRRARCGTPVPMIFALLRNYNLKGEDITGFYEGSSVRSIGPRLPSEGKFLVFSHKHVSAVRDGVIEDWAVDRKKYTETIHRIVHKDDDFVLPQKPKRKVVVNYEQPTKAVHAICEILFEEIQDDPHTALPTGAAANNRRWWSAFRAKVAAECEANGINKTTAAVQTTKWMADAGFYFKVMR